MALHFYMNGTTGAQDGVEISNGDLSNPLVFDGFYAASGVTLSKTKTIHIRADAGEVWHFVLVDIIENGIGSFRFEFKFDSISTGSINVGKYINFSDSSASAYAFLPFIKTIKDVNIPITITASIIGGESSPDVNAKLIISSGVKE